MELIHPRSLERWQEWHRSRHRLREAKHALAAAASGLRRRPPEHDPDGPDAPVASGAVRYHRAGEGEGSTVIGIDSATPSSRASLLASLPYLSGEVHVVAPQGVEVPELSGAGWTRHVGGSVQETLVDAAPQRLVTLGHHLPVGHALHEAAREAGIPAVVVQHGALTPFAPPLPEGATLLAWSAEDAEVLRADRGDVRTSVVGSQLLWQAAHEGSAEPAAAEQADPRDGALTFLGQMHGAELPRRVSAGIAYRFCRREGARYRPHPAEVDVVSRRLHGLMRRRGIVIDESGVPLRELPGPVVGIFSTGILEAAVRGIPAWVVGGSVPPWVREVWRHYDMRRWGGPPTPAPRIGPDEPARLVAQFLEGSS